LCLGILCWSEFFFTDIVSIIVAGILLFWKYIDYLRKLNSISNQLEVSGKHLIEPFDVADSFLNHLQLAYNSPCNVVFPNHTSPEFLSLGSVSDLDIFKAIKRLRLSKSVALHWLNY
jgi:hypothetical protein